MKKLSFYVATFVKLHLCFKYTLLGEEFLQPTTIYSEVILELHKNSSIKSFAHITGGGLTENIIRVLPDNLLVELDATKWNILPVFGWISVMGLYI